MKDMTPSILFSIIILGIDQFKNVNDTYGRECRDKVRDAVSLDLEKVFRTQDTLARWGGEEFVCLLPETEADGVINTADYSNYNRELCVRMC